MKYVNNNLLDGCRYQATETWNTLAHRWMLDDKIGLTIERYAGLWIAHYYSKFSNSTLNAYVIDHPDGTQWAFRERSYERLKQRIDADMLLERIANEHHIEVDI